MNRLLINHKISKEKTNLKRKKGHAAPSSRHYSQLKSKLTVLIHLILCCVLLHEKKKRNEKMMKREISATKYNVIFSSRLLIDADLSVVDRDSRRIKFDFERRPLFDATLPAKDRVDRLGPRLGAPACPTVRLVAMHWRTRRDKGRFRTQAVGRHVHLSTNVKVFPCGKSERPLAVHRRIEARGDRDRSESGVDSSLPFVPSHLVSSRFIFSFSSWRATPLPPSRGSANARNTRCSCSASIPEPCTRLVSRYLHPRSRRFFRSRFFDGRRKELGTGRGCRPLQRAPRILARGCCSSRRRWMGVLWFHVALDHD